jgi:hypothetical protein
MALLLSARLPCLFLVRAKSSNERVRLSIVQLSHDLIPSARLVQLTETVLPLALLISRQQRRASSLLTVVRAPSLSTSSRLLGAGSLITRMPGKFETPGISFIQELAFPLCLGVKIAIRVGFSV